MDGRAGLRAFSGGVLTMAVKYDSAHDSPEDPGGLIRQALDMGAAFPGPAEDILLAWMLRLGGERAAPAAAAHLIATYGIAEGPLPEGPLGRLVALLRETATSPICAPRRRGGSARKRRGGPGDS